MKLSKLVRSATFVAAAGAFTLLTGGSAANAASPAYPPTTATVTGHVYLDTNGNGVQDSGEPNLAGVTVVVTADDSTTQSVVTDTNGNWTAVVIAGSTTATIDETTLPAGVTQTEGTNPTTVTAVAGTTTDAGTDGYKPTATVSGHVYLDTDGNGTQDSGEPNLPGVRLVITDSFGTTQTVITDANGNWTAAVPAGVTTITVDQSTLPAGVKQTEGTATSTVTAVAGADTFVGNIGYTKGTIVAAGSNTTIGGTWLAIGSIALGAAFLAVARVRRRQPVPA